VLLDLPVTDARECLQRAVATLDLPSSIDRTDLIKRLLAREQLCSTALDNGVAIPHTSRTGLRIVPHNVELAQRLLGRTGVRAHSVRDWEAALMVEVDSRLASGAHPATLDAEIVTAVCARLARDTKGAEDRARLSLLRRRG
jgi:hypothetical protein